jgi:hypothetical protein
VSTTRLDACVVVRRSSSRSCRSKHQTPGPSTNKPRVFSPENQATIQDLIATSLKVAGDRTEVQKGSHHERLWPMLIEQEMEAHKGWVVGIERYFIELETGLPF